MPMPFPWSRVVFASTKLSADEKIVWDELRRLDGGEGAYIHLNRLALRVGRSERTVEGIRQRLVRYGLLVRERRGRDRWTYLARLPEPCLPSDRPTDEEVVRFARLLDALLERPTPEPVPIATGKRGAMPTLMDVPLTTPPGVSPGNWRMVLATAPGVPNGGGKGGGIPLENRAFSSIPPSGGEEGGAGSEEPETGRGKADEPPVR